MKKLFAAAILTVLFGCAPTNFVPIPQEIQSLSYIDQHGKSKNDAYVSAHAWVAKNFVSANDVIQMQDKEAGRIIIKATCNVTYWVDPISGIPYQWPTRYSLSLEFKDKKMKTEFTTVADRGGAMPEKAVPLLKAEYEKIHSQLLSEVASKASEF